LLYDDEGLSGAITYWGEFMSQIPRNPQEER